MYTKKRYLASGFCRGGGQEPGACAVREAGIYFEYVWGGFLARNMYREHEVFITPEDSTKIWRYMDFTKFLDILARKALFFPRADKLGDPFEGSLPKASIKERSYKFEEMFRPEFTQQFHSKKDVSKALSRGTKTIRKSYSISCWNIGEEESAALWHLYSNNEGGIAIQTTMNRLKNSFKEETRDIYIGKVAYINYFEESIPINNSFYPFLYKRKSFEYERELRAVVRSLKLIRDDIILKKIICLEGYYVKVNPEVLIDKIYLSPICEKWQKELIKSVLSKFGLKKSVIETGLNAKPLF